MIIIIMSDVNISFSSNIKSSIKISLHEKHVDVCFRASLAAKYIFGNNRFCHIILKFFVRFKVNGMTRRKNYKQLAGELSLNISLTLNRFGGSHDKCTIITPTSRQIRALQESHSERS